MAHQLEIHGRDHNPKGKDPPRYAGFVIKVFPDSGDDSAVITGDGALVWAIPYDLDGWSLVDAEGFVSTASTSGAVSVAIRNVTQTLEMLSTNITIDANETSSFTAATPSVINAANSQVFKGDLISIDVDSAGSNAVGLGVQLHFEL